jgi:hypothetical protein
VVQWGSTGESYDKTVRYFILFENRNKSSAVSTKKKRGDVAWNSLLDNNGLLYGKNTLNLTNQKTNQSMKEKKTSKKRGNLTINRLACMREKFNANIYQIDPEDNTTSSLTSAGNRSLNVGFSPIPYRFKATSLKPPAQLKGLLSTKSLSKDEELKVFNSYMSAQNYKGPKKSESQKMKVNNVSGRAGSKKTVEIGLPSCENGNYGSSRYKLNNFIKGNIYTKNTGESSSSFDAKGYLNSNSVIYNAMHLKKN